MLTSVAELKDDVCMDKAKLVLNGYPWTMASTSGCFSFNGLGGAGDPITWWGLGGTGVAPAAYLFQRRNIKYSTTDDRSNSSVQIVIPACATSATKSAITCLSDGYIVICLSFQLSVKTPQGIGKIMPSIGIFQLR